MGWNCSEIETSRQIFVLTLNRASALTAEGNEQNFLLPLHIVANHRRIGLESKQTACFDLQFSPAISETTYHKLQTLTSPLQMVSKPQNCELKQELRTLATALNQSHNFHNRERRYFFKPAGMGWNCSEIETSRQIFVLTLNRASALTVSDKR